MKQHTVITGVQFLPKDLPPTKNIPVDQELLVFPGTLKDDMMIQHHHIKGRLKDVSWPDYQKIMELVKFDSILGVLTDSMGTEHRVQIQWLWIGDSWSTAMKTFQFQFDFNPEA